MGLLSVVAISGALQACGGGETDHEACLPPLPRAEAGECNRAFTPSGFDIVFDRVLRDSCGAGGGCHSAGTAEGGLELAADADRAYEALLMGGSHAWVQPGDPECSPLMARLESTNPSFQMPPGAPLRQEVRCAIIQWIADGAPR